jgi:hypothetical protein
MNLSAVQAGSEAHPAFCAIDTGPFPGDKAAGVVLTTHFFLMSVGE